MAKTTIKPEDFADALGEQLTLYHKNIIDDVNDAGERAIKSLVQKTKATAPRKTGSYRKNITSKAVERFIGDKSFLWYVKAPFYRLTHLLVHGHAGVNGGRVPGDPFLANALDAVLPEYEKNVEEALKNG